MMFTGTLIADLIAAVECVEKAQAEAILPPDLMIADAWLASLDRNQNYNGVPITRALRVMGPNSNLLGVA